MKYSRHQVWVLETQHGYYPLGTWGFAANVGGDESKAREELDYWHKKSPGEYRLYNNQTGEVFYAEGEATYTNFQCLSCRSVWVEHYAIPLSVAKCPRCDSGNVKESQQSD